MNNSLLRRIGFYLSGLAIGMIMFALLVRGRGVQCEFNYLPNARTLSNIRMKARQFSPEIEQLIIKGEIDTLEISNILNYGDVDFSRSNIKVDSCKLYVIEGMLRNKEIELTVLNCNSTAQIQQIKMVD